MMSHNERSKLSSVLFDSTPVFNSERQVVTYVDRPALMQNLSTQFNSTSLKTIDLSHIHIDAGILSNVFENGINVESLKISNMMIPIEYVSNMMEMESLSMLSLRNCGITDKHVYTITSYNSLISLDLSYNRGITDQSLFNIAASDRLKSLKMRGIGLGSIGALILSKNQSINRLDLSENKLDGTSMHNIGLMSNLSLLILEDCNLTNGDVLLLNLNILNILGLSGNIEITPDLLHFIEDNESLVELEVYETKIINIDQVREKNFENRKKLKYKHQNRCARKTVIGIWIMAFVLFVMTITIYAVPCNCDD